MPGRIGVFAALLSLSCPAMRADVRAVPISIAVVFEAAQGHDANWYAGFRSSFGPQVRVSEFRGEDAWKRALDSRPAVALLEGIAADRDSLRRVVAEAAAAETVPVLVVCGEWPESLRELAGSEKIIALEIGSKRGRDEGAEAARELARIETMLQPFVRPAAGRNIEVVVSPDGRGDFKTIQYAVDHAPPAGPGERLIIHVQPGIYRERVIIPRDRPRVTLLGMDPKSTIITNRMAASQVGGTFLSATVHVTADDFEAENITFENTYGVGSQAVALHLQSDRAVVRNCRLLGWQDTLYAASGRQYFRDSYIEGHVDFIFGNAAAVFEDCEIHSLDSGYIAAQSRTQTDDPTGFVFSHCRLTAKIPSAKVFLGRPWRPYSKVVYLRCWMDAHIEPAGWDNWGSTINQKSAVFGEFESSGPGARPDARVAWARHLTREDAASFDAETFLCGKDGWNPRKLAGR